MKIDLPTLTGTDFVLRPFGQGDANEVERLAGDRLIAATTLHIPHPYPTGGASTWIATHGAAAEKCQSVTLAIVDPSGNGNVIGAVALGAIAWNAKNAELSYWVGVPYWGRGFATRASQVLLDWGFDVLHMHRIHAACFASNPASARVLAKLGMKYEGRLREHVRRFDEWHDLDKYGLLASDRPPR